MPTKTNYKQVNLSVPLAFFERMESERFKGKSKVSRRVWFENFLNSRSVVNRDNINAKLKEVELIRDEYGNMYAYWYNVAQGNEQELKEVEKLLDEALEFQVKVDDAYNKTVKKLEDLRIIFALSVLFFFCFAVIFFKFYF